MEIIGFTKVCIIEANSKKAQLTYLFFLINRIAGKQTSHLRTQSIVSAFNTFFIKGSYDLCENYTLN